MGVSVSKAGFYNDYIDKKQCDSIKGVFILVVFIRHIYPYIVESGYEMMSFFDSVGSKIDCMIGQQLVVMFLFYSGYGVMESIKKKGKDYVTNIPKHRILPTLLNFDVAVFSFIILDLALDISKPLDITLLAFTGWTSVGNSNWYIFVIVTCYILNYFAFTIKMNKSYVYGGWGLLILTFALLLLLSRTREVWWYNTIMCYPTGAMFSVYKQCIERFVHERYWTCLIIAIVAFIILFNIGKDCAAIRYNILSINFAAIIVMFTMKVKIGNRLLEYFGKNLFPLYIYQRLPMILLATICNGIIPKEYTAVYITGCFFITILITYFYKYWQIRIK